MENSTMKKDIGAAALVTPMPVCIVAAYDAEGKPNAMNAAWGMNSGNNEVALFISKPHKTTKNILETKAFTVSIADAAKRAGHARPDVTLRIYSHALKKNDLHCCEAVTKAMPKMPKREAD